MVLTKTQRETAVEMVDAAHGLASAGKAEPPFVDDRQADRWESWMRKVYRPARQR